MNHFPLKTKQKTPACHAYGGFFYCREGVNGPYPSRRYRGEPSSRVLMRLATASIQCASEEVSTGLSAGKARLPSIFQPARGISLPTAQNPHPWASRPAPRRRNSCLHPHGQARARRPCRRHSAATSASVRRTAPVSSFSTSSRTWSSSSTTSWRPHIAGS